MKTKLLCFIFALAATAQAATPGPGGSCPARLQPEERQAQAAHLAAGLLARYHYRPVALDDNFSAKAFDRYLKSLDGAKLFFLQTDIDAMDGFRNKLDNGILEEDLSAPFAIFNRYTQRAVQRFSYARSLLKAGFDFHRRESYSYEREPADWPVSEADMNELWRKRVKNDWLRLRLTGKDDKEIAAILDKRYDNFLKGICALNGEDAFETFMNAFTMAVEPHTNYLGPRAAADFDASVSHSMVGIGGALEERNGYTTIRELVPGSPASLSGQLRVGDRIVGVAQGSGAMIDILGWRQEDAMALFRGPAGSVIRLEVLPAGAGPDGKHKTVTLVRKKIDLDEEAASKSVVTVTEGGAARRIGVIALPSFYEDIAARRQGDPGFKSASRDVARLLAELEKEKVDGVLIDLRNNGGGPMREAIALTGLFVGNGPVVQQRDAQGRVAVDRAEDAEVAWDGPLGVLINRGSASASEIFAAAIQDYGRGLVIGEPSYGKGTVQNMIDLDHVARNDKPLFGELKLTVAQFFRIDGSTTQLRGVLPDIRFPQVSDVQDFGESAFDNALPWTRVQAADYTPSGDVKRLLPELSARHTARVKRSREFGYLEEDIAEFQRQRKLNQVSLDEAERRRERQAEEDKIAAREKPEPAVAEAKVRAPGSNPAPSADSSLEDDGLEPDERNLASDLAAEQAQKNAKDVLLDEAVRIVGDEAALLKAGSALAARARPDAGWR